MARACGTATPAAEVSRTSSSTTTRYTSGPAAGNNFGGPTGRPRHAEQLPTGTGEWLGTTAAGALYQRTDHTIAVGDDATLGWQLPRRITVWAIAPDGRRFAYLDAGTYDGVIVVRDLARRTELRSAPLASPTALTWLDDQTLVFATGTAKRPRLHRARVSTSIEPDEVIVEPDEGWFGHIASGGGRVVFNDLHPATRARIISRTAASGTVVTDLDRTTMAVVLGWTGADEMISWTRQSHTLELWKDDQARPTKIRVELEPASATLMDDTLIVALRDLGGRRVQAYSLVTGEQRWAQPESSAVRCAADRTAPCFSIRSAGGRDEVVRIDPATGVTDAKVLFAGDVVDLAVDARGERLIIAGQRKHLIELDATTGEHTRDIPTGMATARSVALDRMGGLLVTGTLAAGAYQVVSIRDQLTVLVTSSDEIPSLIRVNSDGSRLTTSARMYAPDAWLLELSTRCSRDPESC